MPVTMAIIVPMKASEKDDDGDDDEKKRRTTCRKLRSMEGS